MTLFGEKFWETIFNRLSTMCTLEGILIGLTVLMGGLLFAPELFLVRIGLDGFVQAHRPYIGGAFGLFFVFSAIAILNIICRFIGDTIKGIIWWRKRWLTLNTLDVRVLIKLAEMLNSEEKVGRWNPFSGVTHQLVYYGIMDQLGTRTFLDCFGNASPLPYAPSGWLLKLHQSGTFENIFRRALEAHYKEERTPGTTAT